MYSWDNFLIRRSGPDAGIAYGYCRGCHNKSSGRARRRANTIKRKYHEAKRRARTEYYLRCEDLMEQALALLTHRGMEDCEVATDIRALKMLKKDLNL